MFGYITFFDIDLVNINDPSNHGNSSVMTHQVQIVFSST